MQINFQNCSRNSFGTNLKSGYPQYISLIVKQLENAVSRSEAYGILNKAIREIPNAKCVSEINFIFNNFKFQSCPTAIGKVLDTASINRETNQDILKVIPIKNTKMQIILSRLKEV